jgi:hypothetical protein
VLSPADTEAAVKRILERAQAATGLQPETATVLRHVQSFVLRAPPRFIEAVLSQSGVASAMANEQPGGLLIRPVAREEIDIEAEDRLDHD